jgi:molybdenum cofactor biosynthesis enzyme MoaA
MTAINFEDYGETLDRFLDMRRSAIKALNSGDTPEYCQKCPHLIMRSTFFWDDVRQLNINDYTVCNMDCVFCTSPSKDNKKSGLPISDYRLVINALKEKFVNIDNLKVSIACDEISYIPQCNDILSAFVNYNCKIATNAVIYSEKIKEILENGKNSFISTSMDAGTRETFAKVKNRDAWDVVCNNLHKYSNGGQNIVRLKYIALPGFNDNLADADGFLKLCTDINARHVALSRNFNEAREGLDLEESALNILEYIANKAVSQNLKVIIATYFTPDEVKRLKAAMAK